MKVEILEIITQHKFEHISSEQAISELVDLFAFNEIEIERIKSLFRRYAENVAACEGIYFLRDIDRYGSDISENEWEEIKEIVNYPEK